MDFDIVIGLHEEFQDCEIWHGSAVHHPTKDIWLYLPKDAIVYGLVLSIHMYTGEKRVNTVLGWTFNALNHEFIHLLCGWMGEDRRFFDVKCKLTPVGL